MKKISLTRLAEISSIISFAFLLFPQVGDLWKGVIKNIDWYKTGLLIVFIVSIGIVFLGKYREKRDLQKWLTYHSPNYNQPEFSSLEEKINYLIAVKLYDFKEQLKQERHISNG